jgi:dihydroorotase
MSSFLLKNGTVVTPGGVVQADILVRDALIERVEMGVDETDTDRVIDCTDRVILPGAIDGHVHLRTPGAEYKEDWQTGTSSAVAGGVTTVVDMPNNSPAITNCDHLEAKRKIVQGQSFCDYGFYMGATVDRESGQTNVDEYLASDALALKIYMGSSTGDLLVERHEWIDSIFQKVAAAGRLICVHAEDEALINEHMNQMELSDDPTLHPKIRDDEVAYRAVKFALETAHKYGTRLNICHMSTAREVELVREFAADFISCEVTPHHAFLTQEELVVHGNLAKMNPPLRTEKDREALLQGIRDGVVTMVATDHAPHTLDEKNRSYLEAPAGVPGLETMLPLLLDAVNHGELTLNDVARVTAQGPAQVFGLKNKGALTVGKQADLVVVDMELVQPVTNGGAGARFTKCGWSVFVGRQLKGWPVMTMVCGEVVFEDGVVFGAADGREQHH